MSSLTSTMFVSLADLHASGILMNRQSDICRSKWSPYVSVEDERGGEGGNSGNMGGVASGYVCVCWIMCVHGCNSWMCMCVGVV